MNLLNPRHWMVTFQRRKAGKTRRSKTNKLKKSGEFAAAPSKRFKRFRDWFGSARKKRSLSNLFFGLPAVVIGLAALSVVVLARYATADLTGKYRQLAGISYVQEDYESALLYLERLRQHDGNDDESTYMLAVTLGRMGEEERASAMLDRLAPEDTPGYAKAHLVKARQFLAPAGFTNQQHRNLAYFHVTSARNGLMETDAETAEAHFLSARWHFMAGDEKQGLTYLREATRLEPSYLYDLASVYNTLGYAEDFNAAVENARVHYQQVLSQDKSDAGSRMALGKTLGLLRQFDKAQQVLVQGKALHPQAEFGKQIAILCLVEYDQLLQHPDTKPLRRIQLLQTALDNDSDSMPALKRLLKFGEEKGSSPELQARVDDFLETIISTGAANSVVHLAYGTRAWESGQRQVARIHLKRAYELDERMAVVANNLAWTLAFDEPTDLAGAHELIDSVISTNPQIDSTNAVFRDTRGQILAKLGRWNECQKDLLSALTYMPRNSQLHRTLAESYSKSTPPQPGLAEKHNTIAIALER